jgi:hypothetical protein
MINKALIKNYADAAAVFAKARKPERGKPLGLFRLMHEKNGYGDIYHLYWGAPQKLVAIIHPNNTAEIYETKGVVWYTLNRTLPTIIPFKFSWVKRNWSVVAHTNYISADGSWNAEHTYKHYPGIRFNMETGECVSTEPPPPTINKDRRKEWLRDLRVFKKQFALRAKLGVIDGMVYKAGDYLPFPRWDLNVDWGGPDALGLLFNDIKNGAPSTELLKLFVRHVFSMPYITPDTATTELVFNRVLTSQSINLRKMYGVFDETETD